MTNTPRPRVDDKLRAALRRLRGQNDFKLYLQYLTADLEYTKNALVRETDASVLGHLQGRAQSMQDQIQLLTSEE